MNMRYRTSGTDACARRGGMVQVYELTKRETLHTGRRYQTCGWEVTVKERVDGPAAELSGTTQGLMRNRIGSLVPCDELEPSTPATDVEL